MAFYVDIVNSALIVAVLGFSLNFLIGYTGLISLAQGAMYGVGAYATAIVATRAGLDLPLTVVLSVAVTAVGYTLIAWPALRVTGEYLILLTLAVQFVLVGVYTSWTSVTGGSGGIAGIPRPTWLTGSEFPSPTDLLPFVLVIFFIGLGLSLWIGHSPFGRTLRAVRENESAAVSIGKNVTYYKVMVFLLAGVLAGLAGAAYAHYLAFVSPVSFSLDQSIFLIAVIVLGGAGNIFGTVLGSFILVGFPQLLLLLELDNQVAGLAQRFAYGLLLVLFMIYRPQGLVPEYLHIPLRRVAPARRRRDVVAGTRRSRNPGPPTGDGDGDHPVVVATELCKSFGGVRPADGLSLSLPRGKITALVGPNGAGKTTVFNLLTGVTSLDAGRVELHGRDVTDLAAWQRTGLGLARTFQDVRIFGGIRVIDNVTTAIPDQPGDRVSSLFGRPWATWRTSVDTTEKALSYLDFVGLADRAGALASTLAFAEQKLLGLARLMATEADVLLLDEPASGVDRQWVDKILELVRELASDGRTVCIVEHNLEIVRALASHAYFMDAGKIVADGTPDELMADPHLASIYFGRSGPPTEDTHAGD
ncbi:MAG: ATP-binding cassette domain-containing protein [Pseudonocardiaceae bacterium]|nr:ATP-binding cassette domain-containing protein [Pseudonocardiaceae bacterium]